MNNNIRIVSTTKLGLEIWLVLHGSTLLATYLSKQVAEVNATRLARKLQASA